MKVRTTKVINKETRVVIDVPTQFVSDYLGTQKYELYTADEQPKYLKKVRDK